MNYLLLITAVTLIQVSRLTATKCDWRYYQHYQHKGCEPVIGEDGCPIRFKCQPVSDEMRLKCLHNGKWFNQQEKIQEPCESCSCRGNAFYGAVIGCASVDCPDWEAQDKSCYMGYKPGACCPTEMCPSGNKEQRKTCNYKGRDYDIGQIIQMDDPCNTCVCTEDWNGESGSGCKKVNCLTGIYADKIRKGCLSIYGEKSCCLTEMYCGAIKGDGPVPSPVEYADELCHYQEKYYKKGSTVYPLVKNSIVECKCVVPPDFTCLRQHRYTS